MERWKDRAEKREIVGAPRSHALMDSRYFAGEHNYAGDLGRIEKILSKTQCVSPRRGNSSDSHG